LLQFGDNKKWPAYFMNNCLAASKAISNVGFSRLSHVQIFPTAPTTQEITQVCEN
jgi:hypothetical protein